MANVSAHDRVLDRTGFEILRRFSKKFNKENVFTKFETYIYVILFINVVRGECFIRIDLSVLFLTTNLLLLNCRLS